MEDELSIESSQDEAMDNSDVVLEQEPSVDDDNSDVQNQEPVDKNVNDDDGEQVKEAKFKTFEEALNGYSELEKKLGQQSNELGELRQKAELAEQLQAKQLEIVKTYGFDSVEDFENYQREIQYSSNMARYEADEYAKHITECEFPDEVKNLLVQYRQNPSKELLDLIEAEFPVDTVKNVAGSVAILKGQLQKEQQEALEKQTITTAREYLDVNIKKYPDEFTNPAFTNLYTEAFKAYGCELDTDTFVNLMRGYADSVLKSARIKNGIEKDNQNATDEIAGLTNNGAAQPKGQEKNILEMSEDEMRKELAKYK